MYNPAYHAEWYKKNRERLLVIRRKYNKEYSKRPEVIERARIKNIGLKEYRRMYKKTKAGKEANKRYAFKHKEYIKDFSNRRRLERYGLTPEMVEEMKIKQNNLCLICGNSIIIKFHIDHSHITNKVRGLLCGACNMGLGLFKDSPKLLNKAIQYLQ